MNELIDERFSGDIDNLFFLHGKMDAVADGLHQMSLTQTDSAVDEKRVVGAAWIRSYRLSGTGGKRVVVPDDEPVEVIVFSKLLMWMFIHNQPRCRSNFFDCPYGRGSGSSRFMVDRVIIGVLSNIKLYVQL
jgi:hypothetical protein